MRLEQIIESLVSRGGLLRDVVGGKSEGSGSCGDAVRMSQDSKLISIHCPKSWHRGCSQIRSPDGIVDGPHLDLL